MELPFNLQQFSAGKFNMQQLGFQQPDTIGIDIGSENIKLCVLKRTEKRVLLDNIAILPIPADDKKRPRNQIITELIRNALRHNKIHASQAYFTFSGEGIFYHRDVFPDIKREDLLEAIRWKCKDQVGFSVEAAMVDYVTIREVFEGELKLLELLVVIVSKESIDRHTDMIMAAGLDPIFLSFAPFACAEFYKRNFKAIGQGKVVWLEMGAKYTEISIISEQKIDFARVISFGSKQFLDIIKKNPEAMFAGPEKKEKTAEPAAETEKSKENQLNLATEYLKKIDFSGTLSPAIRNEFDNFIQEVVRSLSYYKDKYGLDTVERVIISGGMADLKGIEELLARELNLTVARINLADHIQCPLSQKKELELNSGKFIALVGLLLIPSNQTSMNFLPQKIKEKLELIELRTPSLFTIAASLLFLLTVWNLVDGQLDRLNKKLVAEQAKLQSLNPLVQQFTQTQNNQNQKKTKVKFVQGILNKDLRMVRFLGEISLAAPPSIVLSSIHTSGLDANSFEGPNMKLSIKGIISEAGVSSSDLAKFILQLQNSPVVEEVSLLYLNQETNSVGSAQGFELACVFKNKK
ncbi:MAG: pilus assembly protein PilM [Candidatus Margulisiibacteriota bacterium]|jgi:type IV pilus assembly protein PilM